MTASAGGAAESVFASIGVLVVMAAVIGVAVYIIQERRR